jgi:hypothetical protein
MELASSRDAYGGSGRMLRVIGIIALVWLGFVLLGAVFKFLFWAIVVGAVVFLGVVTYNALKGKSEPPALR